MSWIAVDNTNTITTQKIKQGPFELSAVIRLKDLNKAVGHKEDSEIIVNVKWLLGNERPKEYIFRKVVL